MTVYEVVRNTGHGPSSTGLFATLEGAKAQVEVDLKWCEDYHGPYYPVRWAPSPLTQDQRAWRSDTYQAEVEIHERTLLT